MVKDLERIGDYVQNIAEDIYYAVSGEPLIDTNPNPTWEAILPIKK
jgi:phosphate uptake regulator